MVIKVMVQRGFEVMTMQEALISSLSAEVISASKNRLVEAAQQVAEAVGRDGEFRLFLGPQVVRGGLSGEVECKCVVGEHDVCAVCVDAGGGCADGRKV